VVYRRPVIALDIVPTAVAAAGGKIPADAALDGVNLLPYVTGKSPGAPHEALYWRFGQPAAIRRGDFKLVRQEQETWQLYNLAEDIGETKDLAAANPAKAKELLAAWEAWNAQLMAPRWGRPVRARQLGAPKKKRSKA
jgi:arylsulfatase A-like enzyme